MKIILTIVICYSVVEFCVSKFLPGHADDVYKRCVMHPPRGEDGYVSVADEEVDWGCMQASYQKRAKVVGAPPISQEQLDDLESLFHKVMSPEAEQERHIRKEYRVMSDIERETFHKALNKMKQKGVYDAMAAYHFGHPESHNGPAFFNWHRIFLLIFEEALRREEPNAILPYWASFWDHELETATASILWDEKFAANSFGDINAGPFSHWSAAGSPYIRNVGATGRLITQDDIDSVMDRTRLHDISIPFADPDSNLERHHDSIHLYIGGLLSDISRVAYDYIFFLHHGLTDCLYDEFQKNQLANGVDPNTDWPRLSDPDHAADRPLSFFNTTLTNLQASNRSFSRIDYYPQCKKLLTCNKTKDCPSKYLKCDKKQKVCVPIEKVTFGDECCTQTNGYSFGGGPNGGSIRNRTEYVEKLNDPDYSVQARSRQGPYLGVQNSYCIDIHRCDTKYWSFFPILINSFRSPDRPVYNSYPVVDGKVDTRYDIYDGEGYGNESEYYWIQRARSNSSMYTNCACRSTAGGGYIQTYGNSYEGNHREYILIDQRLPISSITGYVAVKNPIYGPSDSIVRVYDECGRICRPRCRYSGSDEFVDCDGFIRITPEGGNSTRTHADSFVGAIFMVYSFEETDDDRFIPTYDPSDTNLIFDCDYRGAWPWEQKGENIPNTHGFVTNVI